MSNLFNTNLNELSNQTENTPFVSSEKISPLTLLTQTIPNFNNSSAVKMITAEDLTNEIVSLKAEIDDLKNINSNYINTINKLSNQVNSFKSNDLLNENQQLYTKIAQLTNHINQLNYQNNSLMKRLSAFGGFRS
jgi:hypothetical protein